MRLLSLVLMCCWAAAALLIHSHLPPGVKLKEGQKFEYVVVGAGAAGAAAAGRLALAGERVLLLEAGGDPSALSKIPSAAMLLLGSKIDWKYKTVPNNVSCLSSRGRQCRFSRGKCLGGSTAINYMLYTRGNPRDFDGIPVPGWSWDDLKPYFLKYEGLQDLERLPPSSKPYHNTTGIMRIGFFDDPQNSWHPAIIESFQSLGFPKNSDVNAKSQIGVSQLVGYVYEGERMTSARAYLTRSDVQRRLRVAKFARCTGVIIDNNNTARGVTVVQGSQKLNIYARKEVVLSAGTIGTPQILMLSGIGPAKHLQDMGIRVKVNLPGVGANMTDHILPIVLAQVKADKAVLKQVVKQVKQVSELLLLGSGPLTSNGLTDASVFVNSYCYDFERRTLLNESIDGSDCELPNLQLIFSYIASNLLLAAKPILMRTINLNKATVDQISEANKNHALIVIAPVLLYPHSVGHVRLASADPLAAPAIFPNYLHDARDVDDIVRSIGIVEHLMETPLFREGNATLVHLKLPGCPSAAEDRAGYWRCYCRHMTSAVFHAAGTAALGGVLDARLRVRGVQRLRSADLSALPRAPRASTTAAAVAIGERVAHFILEDA